MDTDITYNLDGEAAKTGKTILILIAHLKTDRVQLTPRLLRKALHALVLQF